MNPDRDDARSVRRLGALGRRILIWTVVLALAPMAIVAYQGYHCAREAIVTSTKAQLKSVVVSRRSRIEAWFAERLYDVSILGQSQECAALVRAGNGGGHSHGGEHPVCRFLSEFKRRTVSYEAISLYDRQAAFVASDSQHARAPQRKLDADILDSSILDRLDAAGAPVWAYRKSTPEGHTRLSIGTALRATDGRQVGYVMADLDLSKTVEPILDDPAGLGQSGKAYLVKATKGTLLAASAGHASDMGAAGLRDTVPVRRALSGRTDSDLYADYRGVTVVGGYTALPAYGWVLVAEIDSREALSWLVVLRNRALVVGLVTLGLVVLFAFRAARWLAAPMRHLAGVARKIAGGDHHQRVATTGDTETRDVASAFNRMLDELEESRQRLARAAALAAIGELSSSVVHELRNPLSSIKMNLQALEKRVADDPVHGELAAIASQQVIRLERMLGDLLSYGKPIELALAPHALGDIHEQAVGELAAEATARHVHIAFDDRTDGAAVPVDRDRMTQVWTNLVRNAIEAVGRDGDVTVSARLDPRDGRHCVVDVSDTGPGFPEEVLQRAFEPFVTTRGDGTGLGLAVVRKIVDYHRGAVSARNGPEGGAVVTVRWPL